MQFRLRALVPVLMVLSLAAAAPARANGGHKTTSLAITITGEIPAAGQSFAGTFNLQGFAEQNGQLVATGNLIGTIADATGQPLGQIFQPIALPVTNLIATCQFLHLELGPTDLALGIMTLHLNRVVLDITSQSGKKQSLGNLLCGVASLLNNQNTTLAGLLSQAIGALTTPATTPVTGANAGNGTSFSGTFTLQGVAVQGGQLVAIGSLTGNLRNSGGTNIGAISQQVTLPLTVASATCQNLTLTLGPLSQNLQGVLIGLNQATLTITPQQGSGNSLGNVLCSVASLQSNQDALAVLLNQLFTALTSGHKGGDNGGDNGGDGGDNGGGNGGHGGHGHGD